MDYTAAYERGRAAHGHGLLDTPMADAVIFDAVKDLPVGGGAAAIFAAWRDGWHAANLATPVD